MRVACAWCNQTLGYVCPFCAAELSQVKIDGRTWLRCEEMLTTIYFDPDNMRVRHSICATCETEQHNIRQEQLRLSLEDQQSIAALDGMGNRGNRARRTAPARLTPLEIIEAGECNEKEKPN